MKPFTNVDDLRVPVSHFLFDVAEKLRTLVPEGRIEGFHVFELKSRLEEFAVDLGSSILVTVDVMLLGNIHLVLLGWCYNNAERRNLPHYFQRPREFAIVVSLELEDFFAPTRSGHKNALSIEKTIVPYKSIVRDFIDPHTQQSMTRFFEKAMTQRGLFGMR